MRRLHCVALLSALAVFTASFAPDRASAVDASTVIEMRIEDLVARCDLALEARVTTKSASIDANGRIATDYALVVDRTFYGAQQLRRTVRIPGGVLPNGRGLVLPGMPTLAVGETALVFLSQPNQHGERLPIGLAQGRLRVAVDQHGTKSLVRDVSDLSFVDAQGQSLAPGPSVTSLSYSDTVARIEAECARRAQGPSNSSSNGSSKGNAKGNAK